MQGDAPARQRVLDAALEVFSRKGYEAAGMGDIAGALGIKAPSLYKHVRGKEELYAALGPLLDEHYAALWAEAGQRQRRLEREIPDPGVLGAEQLERETLAWFQSELDEPRSGCFRRLMALGQLRDPERPDRWLWREPLALYEGFFSRLIAREVLRRGDAHVMAGEYLAPLVQLLALADRAPERAGEALTEARRHIGQFHRVFAHREPRGASPSGRGRLFRR